MTDHSVPGGFVDLDGKPTTLEGWIDLSGHLSNRILATEAVGDVTIKTVWIGLLEESMGVQPFTTILMRGKQFLRKARQYSTPEDAHAGHAEVVAEARRAQLKGVAIDGPRRS